MTSSPPEPGLANNRGMHETGVRRQSPARRSRLAAMLGFLAVLLSPAPLFARGKDAPKPVRIAYQEFNRQMMVDEHNKATSGYAHDYIEVIGTYAGWDVRYLPCDSFAESVRMLLAGEADLIYEISYTKERAKQMLFPDEPMGREYYYLYAAEGNDSIEPGDYSTLAGRTVGVTSGTILVDLLRQWAEKRKVDVRMPEMDGYEATARIRALPGGNRMKIVAYSSNAFEEDREKSLKAGMDGHVAKPLVLDELLAELKQLNTR